MKRKATSDVFDINKNTGALILGSNRLDDYASKFLTKYCKEALLKPMPLPVEEIIQKMRLTVREIGLSENLDIFGCCLLLDSDVKIYDREKNEYKEAFLRQAHYLLTLTPQHTMEKELSVIHLFMKCFTGKRIRDILKF